MTDQLASSECEWAQGKPRTLLEGDEFLAKLKRARAAAAQASARKNP